MKPKLTNNIREQFYTGKMSAKTKRDFVLYCKIISDGLKSEGFNIELDSDCLGEDYLLEKDTEDVIKYYISWHSK